MEELTKDGVSSDSLRYSFAKSCSLSEQKTELKKGLLEGGRKLVYLTGNLRKLFFKENLRFKGFPSAKDEEYIKGMESFKYSLILRNLEMKLREVSRDVNISRDNGVFSSERAVLFDKYLTLVRELSPFCPFICEKVVREL